MRDFFSRKNDKYTVIIGCGRLGASLANTMSDGDGDVAIMDIDKNSFRKLSSSYGGLVFTGDGMDFADLEEAQIDKADIVVAVTNNDNVNIMIAQIAREIYKVKRVIARLYDPEKECVYREFGIDTICPEVLSANQIDKMIYRSGSEDAPDGGKCM